MTAVLRYLIEELGDTLPHGLEEASGFLKGVGWTFVVIVVVIVATTWTYQRAHGG